MPAPSFERVQDLKLATTCEPWPFAQRHAEAIQRHWAARTAENPSFWDGEVFVLRRLLRQGATIEGTLSLERFSAFLCWRDRMATDVETLDGFASAVVRSTEGHVLLGRAAADTLNGGRAFLPGGFIDPRDRRADGSIDLDAAVARELAEETGLAAEELTRTPGYAGGPSRTPLLLRDRVPLERR